MSDTPEFSYPQSLKWYDVWIDVYSQPSVNTFLRILEDPTAGYGRAFIWIILTSIIGGVISSAAQMLLDVPTFEFSFGLILCGALAAPVFAVIGLAFSGWLYHFIAGWIGGTGSFDRMVYAFAAVQAPLMVVSSILSLMFAPGMLEGTGGMSILSLIAGLVSLVISIYAFVLIVIAIRAAEGLDTGKALLVALIPTIIIIVLSCACGSLVMLAGGAALLNYQ